MEREVEEVTVSVIQLVTFAIRKVYVVLRTSTSMYRRHIWSHPRARSLEHFRIDLSPYPCYTSAKRTLGFAVIVQLRLPVP